MNKKLCKEAMFDVADILEKYNIKYHLMGGTLLGAIREKDFIEGDNDVDFGIFDKFWLDNDLFQKIAWDLLQKNIKIGSVWLHSGIHLTRDGEKGKESFGLDLVYEEKTGNIYAFDNANLRWIFPEKFLNTLDTVKFLGRSFPVPHNPEEYLEYYFGKTWKTRVTKNNTIFQCKMTSRKIIKFLRIPSYLNIYEDKIKGELK